MLIIDVIDGKATKTINIPTDWEDMTLNYWCGIFRIINKYKIKKEFTDKAIKDDYLKSYTEELKDSNLDFLEKRDIINMNRELFQYVAQVSDEDINSVDMEEATKVLNAMHVFRDEYVSKGSDSFDFEGDTYFFPRDNMLDNTFGDYIESTQLEMNIENLTNGNYDVLPQQMAILCRKIGEEYDEEEIEKKTEMFRNLKMDTVMEFAFFLTEQSQKLASVLAMYSEEKEEEEEA
jgi:hypothetical protein|tara:strand:- start:193 stop:894 length:702 start_codon:yes stop_codon:yes gene_type:complete